MFRQLLPIVALAALLAVNAQPAAAQAAAKAAAKSETGAMVNINTASVAEFEELPGVGAKTAARIIEYRQKNGPFKKVEELMNIRGIGEKNFLKLKPQLTVTAGKADTSSAKQNQ